MANELLKALTIDGVTNEIEFCERVTNVVYPFTINTADVPYGGATVTLKEGYYYLVYASCWFGPTTSTSFYVYQCWLANATTAGSPWEGGTTVSVQPASAPRLNAITVIKTPLGGGDAVVGAYADIKGASLAGNRISITAVRLSKIVS